MVRDASFGAPADFVRRTNPMRNQRSWLAALALLAALLALAIGYLVWNSEPGGAAISLRGAHVEPAPPSAAALDATTSDSAESRRSANASETSGDRSQAQRVELGRRTRRISARIVDESGRPIGGAELVLRWERWSSAARANETGRATIEEALPKSVEASRRIQIEASARGFAPLRIDRELSDEPAIHLGDLELARGASLAGRVVDARGAPVAAARVLLCWPIEASQVAESKEQGPGDAIVERAFGPFEETSTDEGGKFRFDGVRAANWSVWAGRADFAWAVEPSIALRVDEAREDFVLTLDDLDRAKSISGRVVDPRRLPLANVTVMIRLDDPDASSWDTTRSDRDGRFRFALKDDRAHTLTASSDTWEWDSPEVGGVQAGAEGVELAFREASWLWVHVTTESGDPLTKGRVWAVGVDGESSFDRAVSDMWPDGRARLHRPNAAFKLRIDAPGFEDDLSGPYELANLREPIELVAKRSRDLVGRVTRDGRPVANARVTIRRLAESGKGFTILSPDVARRRFEVRATEWLGSEVRSDRDGRFSMKKPRTNAVINEFCVAAEADGSGAAVSAALTWSTRDPSSEIALELSAGSSLSGRVALASGASPEGWLVIAMDEFGLTREAAVATDGNYRATALHDGPWQVRVFRPQAALRRSSASPIDHFEPHHEVEIHGADAKLDLAIDDTRVFLRGRLERRGAALGTWQAALQRSGSTVANTLLDPDGSFRFELFAEGDYRLLLSSGEPSLAGISIEDRLHVARNSVDWHFELATATLRGSLKITPSDEWQPYLLYESRGSGSLRVTSSISPNKDLTFGPWPVAAGTGEIQFLERRDAFGGLKQDAFAPPRAIEIGAGEERELELP